MANTNQVPDPAPDALFQEFISRLLREMIFVTEKLREGGRGFGITNPSTQAKLQEERLAAESEEQLDLGEDAIAEGEDALDSVIRAEMDRTSEDSDDE